MDISRDTFMNSDERTSRGMTYDMLTALGDGMADIKLLMGEMAATQKQREDERDLMAVEAAEKKATEVALTTAKTWILKSSASLGGGIAVIMGAFKLYDVIF